MIFDLAKFEAIYFFQKAVFLNPKIILLSLLNANETSKTKIIKCIAKKLLIRLLGVYFDSRFFFFDHTEKMANKTRKTALSLSMLIKITREIEVLIIKKTVYA